MSETRVPHNALYSQVLVSNCNWEVVDFDIAKKMILVLPHHSFRNMPSAARSIDAEGCYVAKPIAVFFIRIIIW